LTEAAPADEEETDGRTRRCIASGERLDPALMVRFVVGPDGQVWPDVKGELPGRGLWLRASRAAVDQAVARKAFPRAAKQAVTVPADLADRVEALLAARCQNWLGLAQAAGELVAGYEKVREAIVSGRVAALVQAHDGSAEQRRKLRSGARNLPSIELLTSAELDLALGRQNVIHAALSSGRLAERFLAEASRSAGFREPPAELAPDRATGPVLETE
jgi:predicted RNA-binding protein YlxR (DUF448 family)